MQVCSILPAKGLWPILHSQRVSSNMRRHGIGSTIVRVAGKKEMTTITRSGSLRAGIERACRPDANENDPSNRLIDVCAAGAGSEEHEDVTKIVGVGTRIVGGEFCGKNGLLVLTSQNMYGIYDTKSSKGPARVANLITHLTERPT